MTIDPWAMGAARQAHRLEFHKDKHTSWAEAFDAAIVAGVHAYLAARTETAQKQPIPSETNVNESATDGG
jgi:hypothetical protein